MPELKKFYFTFGFGQKYENCYTIIEAEDSSRAREIMFATFGRMWAFQYNSAEEAGVEEFNLKLVK